MRRGQILNVLRRKSLSRGSIAEELGFNQRSVCLAVDELVSDGLVTEHDAWKSGVGRRPIPVSLNEHAACVLGIDAGRNNITTAVTDLLGNIIATDTSPSPEGLGSRQIAAAIEKSALSFLKRHGQYLPPLAGVGLAVEGIVYNQALQETYAQAAEPARARLESRLGVPVIVDGDSRFTALGEQWFGEAQGLRDVVVMNITDGLGMACMTNGTLVHGVRGWAGEIGHVPLGEPGIPCHCGATGCLENRASGSGILRMARAAGIRSRVTPQSLAVAARTGSAPARDIYDQFARSLAVGVTIAIDLFNPEAVVIGGIMSREQDVFLPAFESELGRLAVPRIQKHTKLIISKLHETAITLGACAKVFSHIYDTAGLNVEDVL